MAQPGPSADRVQQMLQTGDRLHYQHVQANVDEVDYDQFGSNVGHLKYVGFGWAAICGGSIAHSVLDPAKAHLLLSHRLIHARIVAQWATVGALIAAAVGEQALSKYNDSLTPVRAEGQPMYYTPPPDKRKEHWDRL